MGEKYNVVSGMVICQRIDAAEDRKIYRPNAIVEIDKGHWKISAARTLTVRCGGSATVEIYGDERVDIIVQAYGDAMLLVKGFQSVCVGAEGAAIVFVDRAATVVINAHSFARVTATNVREAKITALDRSRARAVLGGQCL